MVGICCGKLLCLTIRPAYVDHVYAGTGTQQSQVAVRQSDGRLRALCDGRIDAVGGSQIVRPRRNDTTMVLDLCSPNTAICHDKQPSRSPAQYLSARESDEGFTISLC